MDNRLSVLSPPPTIAIPAMLAEQEDDINQLETMPFNIRGLTGVGLGPIDAKFLTRQAWPIHNAEQMIQYRKFAQLMIDRIRAGESNDGETERFKSIFDWTSNWIYVFPILGMLPELDDHGPLPMNDQMKTLIDHIGHVVDEKTLECMRVEEQSREERPPMSEKMVTEEIRSKIAKLLLGPEGEANASPAMKRLLTSWVEVGYPKEVIQKKLDHKVKWKGMAQDHLSLPTGLGNHYPKAFGIPGPAAIDLKQKARSATTKALPCHPIPAEYHSSDDPIEDKRKPSYRKFPHIVGESSPEFSDSPPKPIPPNPTNKFSHATASDSDPSQSEGELSFWHFHKSNRHNYEKYLQPVTKADRVLSNFGEKEQMPISTETTTEGTVVAKGFHKPPPAECDAKLKEIIEKAEALSGIYNSDDEAGDEALCEEESSSSRSRRRRKEALSKIDDLSDGETIVGKESNASTAYENTAPRRPPRLPVLNSYEVGRGISGQSRSLDEAIRESESIIMGKDESVKLAPFDLSSSSSWKPLGHSQQAGWVPKTRNAYAYESEQEDDASDDDVEDSYTQSA
ncbi:MAG: hypothetical protein Q9216_002074 [Gyalolechia sp. 2 TL-2023]